MRRERSRLNEYLRLSRFQAAGAVWIVPAVGALAQAGTSVPWMTLAVLFPVSVLTYVLAIVMNEVYDVEVDRALDALSTKPLVSGTISMNSAILLTGMSCFFASVIIWLYWGLIPLAWYVLTVLVGAQYNIWGKRHYWMDLWFAIWAGLYCIFGAMLVTGGWPIGLSPLVYVLALMWFFRMAIVNGVAGGLKDLDNDKAVGARTLPQFFGVQLDEDGRLRYTAGWWLFVLLFDGGFVAAIVLPIYMGIVSYSSIQLGIIGLILLYYLFSLKKLNPRKLDRDSIKRYGVLHEMSGYLILGIMVLNAAGWLRTVPILLVPILWYGIWVRAIYGKRVPVT